MYIQEWSIRENSVSEDSPPPQPSGCCGAASGSVYIVHPDQGCLTRHNAQGKLIGKLEDIRMCVPVAIDVSVVNKRWTGANVIETAFILDAGSEGIILVSCERPGEMRLEEIIHGPYSTCTDLVVLGERIFLSDMGSHCIHVVAMNGAVLARYGQPGSEAGQLFRPWGISADPEREELFVTDSGNHRVQMFTADGDFIRFWGTKGTSKGQFSNPKGVSFDRENKVLAVADAGNNCVQAFDTVMLGRLVWEVDEDLVQPCGVSFDADGDLLVVDSQGAQWFAPPVSDDESEEGSDDESGSGQEQSMEEEEQKSIVQDSGEEEHEGDETDNDDFSDDFEDEEEEEDEEDEEEEEEEGNEEVNEEAASKSDLIDDSMWARKVKAPVAEAAEDDEVDDDGENNRTGMNINSQSKKAESQDSKKKSSRNKLGQRVHQKYTKELLETKNVHLDLRSGVEKLRKERDRLLALTKEQEKQIQKSGMDHSPDGLDFISVMISKQKDANVLDTEEKVQACKDRLALEERLVELKIFTRELRKNMPDLEHRVSQMNQTAQDMTRKAARAQKELAKECPSFKRTEEQQEARLSQLRKDLKAMQDKLSKGQELKAKRAQEFENEKRKLEKDLLQQSDALSQSRLENLALEDCLSALRSKREAALQNLSRAELEFEELGGRESFLKHVFLRLAETEIHIDASVAVNGFQKVMRCESNSQLNSKTLTAHDVDQYMVLNDIESFDFASFSKAYKNLITANRDNV